MLLRAFHPVDSGAKPPFGLNGNFLPSFVTEARSVMCVLSALCLISCVNNREFYAKSPVPITKLDGAATTISGEPYKFKITSLSYSTGIAQPELDVANTVDDPDLPFVLIVQDFRSGFGPGFFDSQPSPKFVKEETVERYVVFDKPGEWTLKADNSGYSDQNTNGDIKIPEAVELKVKVLSP